MMSRVVSVVVFLTVLSCSVIGGLVIGSLLAGVIFE